MLYRTLLIFISVHRSSDASHSFLSITFSRQVQTIISRIAIERGIEVELNADIVRVDMIEDEEVLVAKDGRTFCFDEAVWCTEVRVFQ
jgi:predicted NAD/FAD-binding protein